MVSFQTLLGPRPGSYYLDEFLGMHLVHFWNEEEEKDADKELHEQRVWSNMPLSQKLRKNCDAPSFTESPWPEVENPPTTEVSGTLYFSALWREF